MKQEDQGPIADVDLGKRKFALQLMGAAATLPATSILYAANVAPAKAKPITDSSSASPLNISVFADQTFEPLRLSLVGVAAGTQEDGFIESIPDMDPIGPNYVCAVIHLDGPISKPYPQSKAVAWSADYKSASATPTQWLRDFESRLLARNITLVLETTGAPPQYAQTEPAVKPAEHPAPVNMPGYQSWVAAYFAKANHLCSPLAVLNNEPGHSLTDFEITKDSKGNVILPNETSDAYYIRRRVARESAANIHIQMLNGVAGTLPTYGRAGIGSFISSDSFLSKGRGMTDGTRTFFQGAVDAYLAQTLLSSTFIGYNNYNGRYENDIFGRWGPTGNSLAMPAVFTQMAVARLKIPEGDGLSLAARSDADVSQIGAACDMVTDLERLTHLACEAACRSYWTGGPYSFLLMRNNQTVRRKVAWHALWMFCSVPPRRLTAAGDVPTAPERSSLGVHVIAGSGGGIVRALVWNDSAAAQLVNLSTQSLPAKFSAGTSKTLFMTDGDDQPRDLGPWSGSLTLPGESMALVEWTSPGCVDPTARRLPMGSQCSVRHAPMQIYNALGGWGKWDTVRGLAQLYFQRTGAVHAVATFAGMAARLYLTLFVDKATAGLLRMKVSFEGGVSDVMALNISAVAIPGGTIKEIDLDALGGTAWASSSRVATLDVYLVDAGEGASANIWVSSSLALASSMAL